MRSAAILVALLLAGCSTPSGGKEPLPEEWRGRDLREPGWTNVTLEPGWTYALQYQWPSGQKAAWDWVVLGPVLSRDPVWTPYIHFQLVRAQGSSWQAVVAHDAQEGKDSRTMAQAGTYQIDWMNEFTQPIQLTYKAPTGGTVIQYPPGQGPGCLFQATAACLSLPPTPA